MSKRTVATFKDHEAKKPPKLKPVPPTMPVQAEFRHCTMHTVQDHPTVILDQRVAGEKRFKVSVGPTTHDGLTYKQAARIFGTYVMLNLEAAGLLDGDCA